MTRPKEVERDVASHLKRVSKVATGGMGALACCDLLIVVQALRKYSAALANRGFDSRRCGNDLCVRHGLSGSDR